MTKDRAFVVVMGADQKGIIARVSSMLYERGANIIDVQQKVMDGVFVMTLLAEIGDCKIGADQLRLDLEGLGKEMGLTVLLQSERVIKAMHRV